MITITTTQSSSYNLSNSKTFPMPIRSIHSSPRNLIIWPRKIGKTWSMEHILIRPQMTMARHFLILNTCVSSGQRKATWVLGPKPLQTVIRFGLSVGQRCPWFYGVQAKVITDWLEVYIYMVWWIASPVISIMWSLTRHSSYNQVVYLNSSIQLAFAWL